MKKLLAAQAKRLLVIAVLGLMASPAVAADLGGQGGGYKDDLSSVVGPCAGVSWTGFRIGVLAGIGMTGSGSGTGTASGTSDGKAWTDPLDVSGGSQLSTVGQLEIGADYQFKGSPVVIGAFGNLGYGSGTAEVTYSANGRIGLATGNVLFYGFGGYEKAHLVHTLSDLSGTTLASLKADPDGFVYGAGIDIALGHWYVGLRAERADYGSFSIKGSGKGISYNADVSANDDRGLITVGYKF
jgi:hypothetical protein